MVSLIWRVNIATMLFFTLVQVVVPLIPQYAETISSEPLMIGFAVASISITAILLRPVSGVVSDKWSRSNLMILGLFFASVAYAILYSFGDIFHVVIARLMEGAGVACFVPSSIASAIDQAPKGKLGETLGWRSMMIGIGFTIGPAVGSLLAEILGFRMTFGIASLFLVLLIPLAVFAEPKRQKTLGAHSARGLRDRGFLASFSGLIIYSLAWMGLYTFLLAYLTLLGYNPISIGIFVSIQAVSSLALRVKAGKVADERPATMAYLGLLVMSLALFIIYLTQLPPYVYIAAPIFGIGVGIYVPGSQTLALMRSPLESRGFLSSIYTMGLDIGTLIGPVVFGIIIQVTNSYQDVFALAPVLMFLAAVVVMVPTRGYDQKP